MIMKTRPALIDAKLQELFFSKYSSTFIVTGAQYDCSTSLRNFGSAFWDSGIRHGLTIEMCQNVAFKDLFKDVRKKYSKQVSRPPVEGWRENPELDNMDMDTLDTSNTVSYQKREWYKNVAFFPCTQSLTSVL